MKEEMPSQYWQGVEQFNTGQFYACHDTLEALWIEALEPEKTFYQGILQVAVALYHLGNGNLRGATILLGEGTNRLRRYPSVFGGVDVDEFLDQSVALLKILQHTQPEMITNLILGEDERFPIPKIVMSAEC
ncbi:hypothetical protein DSM106972_033380 [Dulcicalothrix desertica PCC 7102]|uniref:DUF309 domain-containing protein n=1 Tax=Dulcicalothrix desertica PCC 7102 TaxID=232991 RepID=A0A433VJ84_9CYAN|nr:DUF309 domain-containing protein [Dulcicalothrix desertica]RUT06132.1 hypothetical protein DSM106972_033380 [Dulcicalothrix desertica PCC 7102]TWH54208.1 hypothetical protein CAL7102_02220 [Dulcicalothrix desertica PCC 7102]